MRWIHTFVEGDGKNKALLGGKGAGLCEMTRLGLPVPTGFVITTEACTSFLTSGEKWPEGLAEEVERAVAALEQRTGKRFGPSGGSSVMRLPCGLAPSASSA